MKIRIRHFFAVLLLSSSSLCLAQGVEYTVVNDYPTLIANIFGIQCEGVSNVQVIGSPYSIGRYENGQLLGLSSGLAFSTGTLFGSNQPSSVFFSAAMGMPPDSDIASFGVQSGQNPTNFDACSISFDFNPIVSDTISFTYVFASEEYPEYSMSSYTDRFLFLVSVNGNQAENIAFIQGTSTVVEINSVNQYVNSQYYLDNLSGGLPTTSNFVYDGYTTPLTAKFYAHSDSTYHIKLVIADVADDIYDSAIFLDEQESYNEISGAVYVNNNPADGLLEIFNFVQDTTLAIPVESVAVSGGNYNVDSLETGLYHVRFTPDPMLFPNTPPVYFTAGSDWTTATTIGLPCFLSNAGLYSDSLDITNGTSSISGFITIDTSYLKAAVEPLHNALVFLHRASDDQLISFKYSDANGLYSFVNLQAGDYYVRLDVPYIPQLDAHHLTLGDNEIISGADYEVLEDGIHTIDNIVLGLNKNNQVELSIYPNPSQGQFTVRASQNIAYSISTIQGTILQKGDLEQQNGHTLDLSKESSGIYILTLENGSWYKLIKD